jgi:hypothetical protein
MSSYSIDLATLPGGPTSRAMTLGTDALTAFTRAMQGEVTYVYSQDGQLVACIAPPEAGERYEHATEVEAAPRHEETIPVLVRTERRRRRPWFAWGPFEGVF